MRNLAILSALLVPTTCLAQYGGGGEGGSGGYGGASAGGGYGSGTRGGGGYYGGGYLLQRYEEDYSHLSNPSARDDFFDPIKYIPVGPGGRDHYLSFGGQARYRYDYFNNYSFGPGTNDEDGFHLHRYLAHADAHLGENLRAFVQVNAAFVEDREGGGRYGDEDDFDLQQAFVDIKTSEDSNPYALLRVGRQELAYGALRYVTPDDWRNVRRTFDGVKLAVSVPNDTVEIFVTRPVVIERTSFNEPDSGSLFAGIYNSLALPQVLEGGDTRFEQYLLLLTQTSSSDLFPGVDADTYTLGGRFSTYPGYWDFDVEGNYQFGTREGSRIEAWSVATEAGYTFGSVALTPRLSVGLDIASGSPDPAERFNQLFPPTYDYLGHLYLFGRPNLIASHVGLDFHLTDSMTLATAHYVYWRQNTDDALYAQNNGVVRADNGSDASYVGNEIDVAVYWQIDRHWSGYVGYAHFFAGDFIEETGPSKDVDFLYASFTFTF